MPGKSNALPGEAHIFRFGITWSVGGNAQQNREVMTMCGNNNLCACFGNNNWWWIIILVLLFCNCGCRNNGGYCGGNDRCGCDNNCGCC